MNHDELQELVKKFLTNEASEQERQRLSDWYEQQAQNETLWEINIPEEKEIIKAELLNEIKRQSGLSPSYTEKSFVEAPLTNQPSIERRPARFSKWYKTAAAAAILVLIGSGTYLWMNNKDNTQSLAIINKVNEVNPGHDGAILTLADGRQLVLDSLQNGTIATEGKTDIVIENGQLIYNASLSNAKGEMMYNTMSTPKGRQYQLSLPDGSKVWLNSASSITYPVIFLGDEREVKITGEAYFEIAKNRAKPFRVKIADMDISVLGTHFNVKGYEDENVIATTLIEGKVKVAKNTDGIILSPGQQATTKINDKKILLNKSASREQVMAWKNGLFHFENADLQSVMRQLARWYDVEIIYEGVIPSKRFEGEIPMDAPASQVLTVLEKNNVHFTIEGKKIIVKPKPE